MLPAAGPMPVHVPASREAPPLDAEPTLDVSVVVPCYRDGAIIARTCEVLLDVLSKLGRSFELILVNDGSPDDTWEQIRRLCEAHPGQVVGVNLWRNFGQHLAVCAGFSNARGRIIVTIDSDLQEDPAHLGEMLERLEQGFDVVSGARLQRAEGWARALPSRLIKAFLQRVTGQHLEDFGCMFRAYRREMARIIERYPTHTKLITAYSAWIGARISEIPMEHRSRLEKPASRYTLQALFNMATDLLANYTYVPMRLITGCGILFFLSGMSLAGVLLTYRVIFGAGPSGMATLVALQFMFAGVQLGCLGILGAYVGRIYSQVDGKPFVLVREVLEK
ncbi:MAG: glycosyltransferase [Candidatus Riflebacteria bacterium]|nr:glycosyltransferase [Candidatus Riflebacteria bacterium]